MNSIKFRGSFKNKHLNKVLKVFTSDSASDSGRGNIVRNFWSKNREQILRFKNDKASIQSSLELGFEKMLLTNAQFEQFELDDSFVFEEKSISNIFEQIKANI